MAESPGSTSREPPKQNPTQRRGASSWSRGAAVQQRPRLSALFAQQLRPCPSDTARPWPPTEPTLAVHCALCFLFWPPAGPQGVDTAGVSSGSWKGAWPARPSPHAPSPVFVVNQDCPSALDSRSGDAPALPAHGAGLDRRIQKAGERRRACTGAGRSVSHCRGHFSGLPRALSHHEPM